MKKIIAQDVAVKAVNKIFEDLRDRRTLKWLFEESENGTSERIKTEIQMEIHQAWRAIIVKALRSAGVKT